MAKIPTSNGIVKPLPILIGQDVSKTPSKYNGGQNYTRAKYCINVDYLTITTKGYIFYRDQYTDLPKELNFGKILLKKSKSGKGKSNGTKNYCATYDIFLAGERTPFGTIATLPRKGSVLDSALSELKVSNDRLYREGWTDKLTGVLNALKLEINNYTRLDIAIDGKGFYDFLEGVKIGYTRMVGRALFNAPMRAGKTDYFTVGRRSSDKYLRCYRKSRELARSNKSYIKEFWLKNGFVIDAMSGNDVERLEVELKGGLLKKLVATDTAMIGIDYTRFEDAKYIAGIFKAVCKKWFEFRDPSTGSGNISRMDDVGFIDWAYFDSVQMERLQDTAPSNEVWQAKRAATKLVKDGQTDYLGEALLNYFEDHFPSSLFSDRFKELCMNAPIVLAHAMAKKHFIGDWLEFKAKFIEDEANTLDQLDAKIMKITKREYSLLDAV